MSKLMQALYCYAQEHLVAGYLHADEEYRSSRRYADKQETALRNALTPELTNLLDDFLGEQLIFLAAENEAAFRAGFVLATELWRQV